MQTDRILIFRQERGYNRRCTHKYRITKAQKSPRRARGLHTDEMRGIFAIFCAPSSAPIPYKYAPPPILIFKNIDNFKKILDKLLTMLYN